jgi:hypothetical protein
MMILDLVKSEFALSQERDQVEVVLENLSKKISEVNKK